MVIYFATWLEDNQGKTLTVAGADNRLLSYFFLKEIQDPTEFFKDYVGTGIIPVLKKKGAK